MRVYELIELLQRCDPDARVGMLVDVQDDRSGRFLEKAFEIGGSEHRQGHWISVLLYLDGLPRRGSLRLS